MLSDLAQKNTYMIFRNKRPMLSNLASVFLLLVITESTLATDIRVAVASNFAEPMKMLASRFEQKTGHKVILAFASTGKHYAQITNGAPFDAFFAADVERPRRLEEANRTVRGSRFTYAIGRLVLWSPRAELVDKNGTILERGEFRRMAIANPRFAPYGLAAQQVLQTRGLWNIIQSRLVRGENISQSFHFVASGNAELGFVALSQIIKRPPNAVQGSYWKVPQSLYRPIQQQAVMLKENDATRSFLGFVRSPQARKLIEEFGYDLP